MRRGGSPNGHGGRVFRWALAPVAMVGGTLVGGRAVRCGDERMGVSSHGRRPSVVRRESGTVGGSMCQLCGVMTHVCVNLPGKRSPGVRRKLSRNVQLVSFLKMFDRLSPELATS